jgi:uncharacterized membrane protein YbhN (UPF0104 family)
MSKKWLVLTLKFLVLGFLFWFLSRGIDFADAARRVAAIDPLMLVGAAGIMLVQTCVGGQRWRLVLSAIGADLSIFKAIQLFYIGVFFSQALPSSVGGDAVRMFKIYNLGMELRNAINGVLLVTVGCAGCLVFLMVLDRLPSSLTRWRLVRGLGNLGIDARKVFLVPGNLVRVMFWGILTHINMALIVLILALGLGLDVTLLDCLTLVPPVMLIMTIPISIGGWGVRETAMVSLFGLIGVPGEGAFALSVVFGLTGIAVAIPGGIIWLMSRDKGETMDYQAPDETLNEKKSVET